MKPRAVLLRRLAMLAVLAGAPLPLTAQPAPAAPPGLEQLGYRFIGPVGNRVTSIVGIPTQPLVYYAGAASGGVWKTSDGGAHWAPLFDSQPVQSIGSLAIAASDANVVWAGTGEDCIRGHISIGNGIYKS